MKNTLHGERKNKMGKMKDILTKVKNSVFPSTKAKTEKEIANENGEPYRFKVYIDYKLKVIQVDFPEGDAKRGSFELDWNDKFIDFLRENGYNGTNDEDIVDTWFNDIARNIVFEANQADKAIVEAPTTTKSTKLDEGRKEYS